MSYLKPGILCPTFCIFRLICKNSLTRSTLQVTYKPQKTSYNYSMEIITSICLHLGQTRIFQGQQDWAKVAPIGGPKLPHGVLRKKSQK